MSSGSSCIAILNQKPIKGKFLETESKLVLTGSEKRREWEVTANGYGVSFWGNENVLKLVCYTKCKYAKMVYFMVCELYINKLVKNSLVKLKLGYNINIM